MVWQNDEWREVVGQKTVCDLMTDQLQPKKIQVLIGLLDTAKQCATTVADNGSKIEVWHSADEATATTILIAIVGAMDKPMQHETSSHSVGLVGAFLNWLKA